MEIYVRYHYNQVNDKYIENGHRNFSNYNKAKDSIDEYLKDFEDIKVKIVNEKEDKNSQIPYQLTFYWYDEIFKKEHYERLVIHKEYVY